MRVARLHGIRDIRIHDAPEPAPPRPGWSTVEVTSVGLCGSDLHWFTEGGIGEQRIGRPVVPGHEFAGVVRDGPHRGRRVAVDPAIPCDACTVCRAGNGNLCPEVTFAGHGSLDGALQERTVWPDHLLFPLPDALSDDAGALLEPLGVAIHAVSLAHVRLGDDVLVVGAGPIGLLATQVAYRAGADRVFVSEPLEHRRAAARALCDDAWAPPDTSAGILAATAGVGVHAVIEIAGNDGAVATAIDAVRPGGRVALAGIPDDDRTSLRASPARRKGITFSMVRRMHDTYPRAIRLATRGIDLDRLVTARYALDDAAAAFGAAAGRLGLKTVITVCTS